MHTSDGYHVRAVSHLLSSVLNEALLNVDEKGITLRETDQKEEIMIDLTLRANTMVFEAPTAPLSLGFNCQHLYKMLSRLKKKDTLTMFTESRDQSTFLSFKFLNNDKDRDKVSAIHIKEVDREKEPWDLPVYPSVPNAMIPASEFQKTCKDLSGLNKHLTISVQEKGVCFSSGTPPLLSVSDNFGEWVKDGPILYEQTFNAKKLARLKCNGLAPNGHLFLYISKDNDTIRLTSPVGTIGTVDIYVVPLSSLSDKVN